MGPTHLATWIRHGDAIWYSKARVTSEGWLVEMRIPYSMLRFSDAKDQVWGIHFTRRIPRLGEQSEWPHVPRVKRDNLIAEFGQLKGISDVRPAQKHPGYALHRFSDSKRRRP